MQPRPGWQLTRFCYRSVMPYRWHKGADTTGRSQTFNYIMGDYLIPGTNPNEIYEKRKDGTPW